MGGIVGERTFCAFAKKKCVFLKKESIVCFEPKSVGGILGKMIFLCFWKEIACALEKEALSVLNQTVWEAF